MTDKRIDVLKRKNVFALNVINVEVKGKVVIAKENKKRKIVIKEEKASLIIPNKKYENSLNYIGVNYFINCVLSSNNKICFCYVFYISPITVIFSFKYPLSRESFLISKNKILIDIPIDIKSENEFKVIKLNPRDYINSHNEHLNIKDIDRKNIVLKRIEIYPYIELYGIYIDEEIDYVKIFKEKETKRKEEEKEKEMIEKINIENENKIKSDLQSKKEIKFAVIEENSDESDDNNDISSYNISINNISVSQGNNTISLKAESNDFKQSVHSTISHHPLSPNTQLTNSTLPILSQSTISLQNISNISSKTISQLNNNQSANKANIALQPVPIYEMNHIIGFTPQKVSLLFHNKETFYISYDTVVQSNEKKQKFYHSGIKCAIDNIILSDEGKRIIITQGKLITFFDTTTDITVTIETKYKSINIIDVDMTSKYLLVSGNDINDNTDVISIFDIESEQPSLYISQISGYSIIDMKFDINDTSLLLSCGYRSIRIWNKTSHDCLIGKNIKLNKLCDSKFSHLQFDVNNTNFAFVICDINLIYVNFIELTLDKIFSISTSEITCIKVNKNYVIVGTNSGDVSAWENNINNVYSKDNKAIEANCNNEPISDIIDDNDTIVIGTQKGSVYTLHCDDKSLYKNINSITETICDIAIGHNAIVCIYQNGSFNVYINYKEIFIYDKVTICALIVDKVLYTGHDRGILRCFHIEDSNVKFAKERKIFREKESVIKIKTIDHSNSLIALSNKGTIAILDLKCEMITIKEISIGCVIKELSISVDETHFAFCNNDSLMHSNTVYIYSYRNFELKSRIEIASCLISHICLIHYKFLCVVLKNASINFYSIDNNECTLIKSIFNVHHKNDIDIITVSKNYKYILTVSLKEGALNVWSGLVAFSSRVSMQKVNINEEGIRLIAFDESSCDLMCVMNDGKRVSEWKFKGEVVFNDKEVENKIDMLNDKEYVNKLLKKNATKICIDEEKGKVYQNSMERYIIKVSNKKEEIDNKKNPNEELVKINSDELEKRELIMTLHSIYKLDNQNIEYLQIDQYYNTLPSIYHSNTNDSNTSRTNEQISKVLKHKLLLPPNISYQPERQYHNKYIII